MADQNKISELNGLEFAELLHQVCERLEKENQNVVEVQRPMENNVFIVITDDDVVYGQEMITDKGRYFSTSESYISSFVKL